MTTPTTLTRGELVTFFDSQQESSTALVVDTATDNNNVVTATLYVFRRNGQTYVASDQAEATWHESPNHTYEFQAGWSTTGTVPDKPAQ